jgi:hypothetical protein
MDEPWTCLSSLHSPPHAVRSGLCKEACQCRPDMLAPWPAASEGCLTHASRSWVLPFQSCKIITISAACLPEEGLRVQLGQRRTFSWLGRMGVWDWLIWGLLWEREGHRLALWILNGFFLPPRHGGCQTTWGLLGAQRWTTAATHSC